MAAKDKRYNFKWRNSGGFRDYRARGRNHLRGPCLKIFVNQYYSSSSFSLKLLCLKDVFKCFPVISFQVLVGCGAPSGLPKHGAWGCGPPGPSLKPPLTRIGMIGEFFHPLCFLPAS